MKIFRNFKDNKKSYIIWALMIFAIGAMLQNGAGASAMAFNGRYYDFFSVNLGSENSTPSHRENFDGGRRFSSGDFGQFDRKEMVPPMVRPGNSPIAQNDAPRGQFGGWDDDFGSAPYQPSRRRNNDQDQPISPRFVPVEFKEFPGDGTDPTICEVFQDCDDGDTDGGDVDIPPVTTTPEPATLALLGSGLFGLAGLRRKQRS